MRRTLRDEQPAASPTGAGAEERALASALRMLARGPRSRVELEGALKRRGHPDGAVAAVLARLVERGYVDDALVADAVARGAARKQLGSRRVALTLRRRGVAREVVEQAVQASGEGDLERARALLARRFPGGLPATAPGRGRAARLLAARGFPRDVVRRALGIDLDVSDDAVGPDEA